jgi:hypothetical protein
MDNMFDMADSYIKRRARSRCPSFYRQCLNIQLTAGIILSGRSPGARPKFRWQASASDGAPVRVI